MNPLDKDLKRCFSWFSEFIDSLAESWILMKKWLIVVQCGVSRFKSRMCKYTGAVVGRELGQARTVSSATLTRAAVHSMSADFPSSFIPSLASHSPHSLPFLSSSINMSPASSVVSSASSWLNTEQYYLGHAPDTCVTVLQADWSWAPCFSFCLSILINNILCYRKAGCRVSVIHATNVVVI